VLVGLKNNIKSEVSRNKPNDFGFVLKNHKNSHGNPNPGQAFPVLSWHLEEGWAG